MTTVIEYYGKGEVLTRLCGFALGDVGILEDISPDHDQNAQRKDQLRNTLRAIEANWVSFNTTSYPTANLNHTTSYPTANLNHTTSYPAMKKGIRNIVDHTRKVGNAAVEAEDRGSQPMPAIPRLETSGKRLVDRIEGMRQAAREQDANRRLSSVDDQNGNPP